MVDSPIMSTHDVRLVCFDLGGVIIRICHTWAEGCAAAGLPDRLTGQPSGVRREMERWNGIYELGGLSAGEFFRGCSESIGGLYSPEELRRIHVAWLLGEYPGMEQLVEELRNGTRVSTGCLSNTNELHWGMMESSLPPPEFRAFRRLEHRHASHLLKLVKPALEVFRGFEDHTGFGAREILFFDDKYENVRAARDAGWNAECVRSNGDPARQIRASLVRRGIVGVWPPANHPRTGSGFEGPPCGGRRWPDA